jgi:hypothetical protein
LLVELFGLIGPALVQLAEYLMALDEPNLSMQVGV